MIKIIIPPSFEVNSKVKFNPSADTRYVNDSMKEYIKLNKDRIYKIERVGEKSVKLRGVGFWVTKDLLEMVVMKVGRSESKKLLENIG